jgi:hypothetical protein
VLAQHCSAPKASPEIKGAGLALEFRRSWHVTWHDVVHGRLKRGSGYTPLTGSPRATPYWRSIINREREVGVESS